MVEYREIDRFPDYRVGDDGSVWSKKSGVWLEMNGSRTVNRKGEKVYCTVVIRDVVGRPHGKYKHRLVLEAFVGPCPEGMEARHYPDRDPTNNKLDNLSWANHIENEKDKEKHGTKLFGECVGNSKLRESDVLKIRDLYSKGDLNQYEIAQMFDIRQSSVKEIILGRVWKHLPGAIESRGRKGTNNNAAKLTEQKVRQIRLLFTHGWSIQELATRFGVRHNTMSCVIYGKTWRRVQ